MAPGVGTPGQDYAAWMQNPSRVIHVEWRKALKCDRFFQGTKFSSSSYLVPIWGLKDMNEYDKFGAIWSRRVIRA